MIISQVLVLKVGSPGHRPHTWYTLVHIGTLAERHFQCPRSPHFHQHGILTATVVFANINLPGDLKLNFPDDSRCIFFFFLLILFIWLCPFLVEACKIFSCSMWDLVPRPGIEPRPPALGARSLSHWTTREVPWCIFFGYHWDCYHHVFIDWIFQVPAVCLHLPLLFCGCRILCVWEPGSHWKWRSSSRRNASLCSATTIPVQVRAGCVLFTAGLQGSWAALLRIMCLSSRFGTEAGKHWKCLLFCSLAGRIRVRNFLIFLFFLSPPPAPPGVRNFVWIPFVWPVLSGSVLLLHRRMSS